MERYLAAAKTISRLAVGTAPAAVDSDVYRVAPDAQQHDRADGLPFGTRGGTARPPPLPADGEYDIQRRGRLAASGLATRTSSKMTIDGEQVKLFTLRAAAAR